MSLFLLLACLFAAVALAAATTASTEEEMFLTQAPDLGLQDDMDIDDDTVDDDDQDALLEDYDGEFEDDDWLADLLLEDDEDDEDDEAVEVKSKSKSAKDAKLKVSVPEVWKDDSAKDDSFLSTDDAQKGSANSKGCSNRCVKKDCKNPKYCYTGCGVRKLTGRYSRAVHRGGRWYKNTRSNKYWTQCKWRRESVGSHSNSPMYMKRAGKWIRRPRWQTKRFFKRNGKWWRSKRSSYYWANGRWTPSDPKARKNCYDPTVKKVQGSWRKRKSSRVRKMVFYNGRWFKNKKRKYYYSGCRWRLSRRWVARRNWKNRMRARRSKLMSRYRREVSSIHDKSGPLFASARRAARKAQLKALRGMVHKQASKEFTSFLDKFMKQYLGGVPKPAMDDQVNLGISAETADPEPGATAYQPLKEDNSAVDTRFNLPYELSRQDEPAADPAESGLMNPSES